MTNTPPNSISLELVAGKLASARNLEHPRISRQLAETPRLEELVVALQWFSFQPGGIDGLVEKLLAAFADRFISSGMVKAGPPKDGRYSLEQCLKAWDGMESWEQWDRHTYREICLGDFEDGLIDLKTCSFVTWLALCFDPHFTADGVINEECGDRNEILDGVERFNYQFLDEKCKDRARERLPRYLRDLCECKSCDFDGVEYCPDLIATLFDYLDLHAAETLKHAAVTEVTSMVLDGFAYAWECRISSKIQGNSRFGKTESATAYCQAYPGRFRLVNTPSSNRFLDLIGAIAEAFGYQAPFDSKIRDKVQYILRNCNIGLALDEAHFLFPVQFTRNTDPARLQWLRTEVIDRGLPCVLITTPQAFTGQSERFCSLTHHNMDQFNGRILHTVTLPEVLSADDVRSVVALKFPELDQASVNTVVGAALSSASFLNGVDRIACRARWIAGRRKSPMCYADVMEAIRDVDESVAGYVASCVSADSKQPDRESLAEKPRKTRKTRDEIRREILPCDSRTFSSPVPGLETAQKRAVNLAPV